MDLQRYEMRSSYMGAAMERDPDGDWCEAEEVSEHVTAEARRIAIQELSRYGFFLAMDNSNPPQLWVWKGVPGDEAAEPWQRVNTDDPDPVCTCPVLDGHEVTGSSRPIHGLPAAPFDTWE